MIRYKQDIVLYGGISMKKLLCVSLATAMLLSNVVVANAETSFKDVPSNHWAAPYIEEMAEAGFISGYEDKTFKPDKDISHLEGIVLFARAMGSNSEAMDEILGYAVREYGDVVDEYDLAFGKNEVCDPIRVKAIYVTKNHKKITQKNQFTRIFLVNYTNF